MTTDLRPTTEEPTRRGPAWQPYRLTVSQFLAMIDAGVFPYDAHVELLGGVLVQMMTKGDPHDYTLGAIAEELRRSVPEGWLLREDKSLQLGPRSRPEPDVTIVRGPRQQYTHRTPHARDTGLVVEVSDLSYAYDRSEKWRASAAARIPIYWIVDLDKAQVEVHAEPIGRGKAAHYRLATIFGIDAEVPVVIDGRELGRVVVKEILP